MSSFLKIAFYYNVIFVGSLDNEFVRGKRWKEIPKFWGIQKVPTKIPARSETGDYNKK